MARLWALPRPILRPGIPREFSLGGPTLRRCSRRRGFLTLAIETSCDDTCVALLLTSKDGSHERAHSIHNLRLSCANKHHRGIHPVEAVESHTRKLPGLVKEALEKVPDRKPDLIAVTRGPGMAPCLSVGVSFAKALAVSQRVPLVGVHHMQAHALTIHLQTALQCKRGDTGGPVPQYPFLTLLVSGGHTMLVYTKSIIEHRVLASTQRGIVDPREKGAATAIGEMLDKCARDILPEEAVPASEDAVVYAQLMEHFCKSHTPILRMMRDDYKAPQNHKDDKRIYQSEKGSWSIPPPLRLSQDMIYNFTGLGGKVRAIMGERPDMPGTERKELAYTTMRLAFEHIMSRVIMALQNDSELLANPPHALVISGGVASNEFLRNVAASMLRARGFDNMTVTAPKPALCTDNALMIAWAGLKMYQAGWTTDLSFLPQREWPIEEIITGVDCWVRNDAVASPEPASNTAPPGQDKPHLPGKSEPQEPDAVAAPKTGVANRSGAEAKSITPAEDKAPETKPKSDGNKSSAEADPGRPSSQSRPSQNRRRLPSSEGPDSPPANTAQAPPSQPAKRQPERSSPAPVKRAKAEAQLPSGTGKSDPVSLLKAAEELLLSPTPQPAAEPPKKRPGTGQGLPSGSRPAHDGKIASLRPDKQPGIRLARPQDGPRDSLTGVKERAADRDTLDAERAAWRREQTLRAFGHMGSAAPTPAKSTATLIHLEMPEKPRRRPSIVRPEANSGVIDREVRPPGRRVKAEEKEKKTEKRFVRLLPPAPADRPAPEGSFRTGLNTLKRWVGL